MRSMHPIRVYERQGADLNVTEDGLRSPHGPSHRLALTVGKCSGRDQSGTKSLTASPSRRWDSNP